MLQEVESDKTSIFSHIPVKKIKQKRFECAEPAFPESFVSQRKYPAMIITRGRYEERGPALKDAIAKNILLC